MKYYNYRLLDFLNEEAKQNAGTKQFYDGDSDTGTQAGKPDAKEAQGDHNLKQVANAIAASVKSHTDAKAKFDSKNLQASGKIKVKAGKNVSIAGHAQVDMKTGKADFAIPIKVKDKEVNLNIRGLDVSNPQDLHGKDIEGSFVDPVTNKEITVGINIDPDKDKYSFTAGETKDRTSFDVSLDVKKTDFRAGAGVGFDSRDFIPSKFSPKVRVGVDYDSTGGFSGNVTMHKDFKLRTGNVAVSAQGRAGDEERYAGVGVTYTPDKKKKEPKGKADKIATKGMKKAKAYVDTDQGGLKMVKDKEGKEVTKISKKVDSVKQDVKNVKKAAGKAANKLKENKLIISKQDLKYLVQNMLEI